MIASVRLGFCYFLFCVFSLPRSGRVLAIRYDRLPGFYLDLPPRSTSSPALL